MTLHMKSAYKQEHFRILEFTLNLLKKNSFQEMRFLVDMITLSVATTTAVCGNVVCIGIIGYTIVILLQQT